MKTMKVHHIGIVTKQIEDSVRDFEKMHHVVEKTEIIFDEEQGCHLAYLKTDEGLNVEFISGEIVKNIVEKNIFYYHLCYEVGDLNVKIEELRRAGATLISPPRPARLFDKRKVAFLSTPCGLIELLSVDMGQ